MSKIISIRLDENEFKQLTELKQYYAGIFGVQNNTWVIKQSMFQEWLNKIEIPRHNKTTG